MVVHVLLQIATSLDQVREFLSGTLLYVQKRQLCAEKSLWEVVQQCVDLLKDKDLITVTTHSDGQTLHVTKLGKATYKGDSHSFVTFRQFKHKRLKWNYTNSSDYCELINKTVRMHSDQYDSAPYSALETLLRHIHGNGNLVA